MQDQTLKEILITLQFISKSLAEISGKFEAHSTTTYSEQLELRGEVRKIKNELSEQTVALNTLAEEVTNYEEN